MPVSEPSSVDRICRVRDAVEDYIARRYGIVSTPMADEEVATILEAAGDVRPLRAALRQIQAWQPSGEPDHTPNVIATDALNAS